MSTYFDLFEELASDEKPNSEFTEEQLLALNSPFKTSSLIRAGAGSGKTKVAVARIVKLLKNGADPKKIALISFTKASANELHSRILKEAGNSKQVNAIFSGTVHSLAYKLMAEKFKSISLIQESEAIELLKSLNPDDLLPSGHDLSHSEMLLQINKAREEKNTSSLFGMLGVLYKEKLQESQFFDFTYLLEEAEKSLKSRNLFDYIVVDESQDLAFLQYSFIKKVGPKAAFWFVGDEDQSIYAFRGSNSSMMSFLEENCDQSFVLSKNFRCSPEILEKANNLISHNDNRVDIQWKSSVDFKGVFNCQDVSGTEQFKIAQQLYDKYKENFMVLARTQKQVKLFKDQGLPCKTVHESKGLEWDCVLIVDCNQNCFPHKMSSVSEERRLFYVAMTRAKKHLEICSNNSLKSKASQFLTEIHERKLNHG